MQSLYRFLAGGVIVSLFAVMGNVLKPKSFAGLFGAAPSVALATMSLSIWENGKPYAALEGRSMIAGALALFVYAHVCMRLMKRTMIHSTAATTSALTVWLVFAISAWFLILR